MKMKIEVDDAEYTLASPDDYEAVRHAAAEERREELYAAGDKETSGFERLYFWDQADKTDAELVPDGEGPLSNYIKIEGSGPFTDDAIKNAVTAFFNDIGYCFCSICFTREGEDEATIIYNF